MKKIKLNSVNMTVLYVLVGIAFVMITVMNISAYRIISDLGDSYSNLGGITRSFKDNFKKSCDELEKVINGKIAKSNEPLEKVYLFYNKAYHEIAGMSKMQPRLLQLEKIMKQYNEAVGKTFVQLGKRDLAREEYSACRKYVQLANALIEATEEERASLLKTQMGVVRFIYIVLLIGNFVAFGAIFFVVFANDHNFKKKEKNLNNANANFFAVMQGLDSVLLTIDRSGVILSWNSNAVRYFNHEEKDAVGKNIYSLLPTFQQFKDYFEMVCNSKNRQYKYHERIHINKGPMRIVDILCVPILPRGANKNEVHLLLKMDDVTSFSTEADHQLRERNIALLRTGMENVMHESASFTQQTAEVLKSLNGFAEQHGLQNEIGAYTAFLNNDLAQLSMVPQKYSSTLQSGVMHKIQIDINELIMYVLRICLRIFPSNANLEVSLNETKSWVMADPAALSRVLFCIMNNAAEAVTEMRGGADANKGGIISVSVEKIAGEKIVCDRVMRFRHAVKEPPYWVILISDTGVGIPQNALDKIYDPFFTLKDKASHKGFGLTVAINVINALGGYIDVNTKEGRGSVFKIYLPELPGVESNETSAKSNLKDEESSIACGTGTVLLVSDDIFMSKVTSKLIESLGYTVISSDNGFEALDLYARDLESPAPAIQCILINTSSTYFKNTDIVQNMKVMNPNVAPVVMVSSEADAEVSELKSLGVTDFITQPYEVAALSKVLAKYARS